MEEDKVMEFWDQFAEESRDQQSDQSNDQCADDMEEISNINFSTTWQKESAKFNTTKNLSLLSDVNPILYDIEHNSIIEDNVHRHEDNQPLFEMNQTSHDRKNSSTYSHISDKFPLQSKEISTGKHSSSNEDPDITNSHPELAGTKGMSDYYYTAHKEDSQKSNNQMHSNSEDSSNHSVYEKNIFFSNETEQICCPSKVKEYNKFSGVESNVGSHYYQSNIVEKVDNSDDLKAITLAKNISTRDQQSTNGPRKKDSFESLPHDEDSFENGVKDSIESVSYDFRDSNKVSVIRQNITPNIDERNSKIITQQPKSDCSEKLDEPSEKDTYCSNTLLSTYKTENETDNEYIAWSDSEILTEFDHQKQGREISDSFDDTGQPILFTLQTENHIQTQPEVDSLQSNGIGRDSEEYLHECRISEQPSLRDLHKKVELKCQNMNVKVENISKAAPKVLSNQAKLELIDKSDVLECTSNHNQNDTKYHGDHDVEVKLNISSNKNFDEQIHLQSELFPVAPEENSIETIWDIIAKSPLNSPKEAFTFSDYKICLNENDQVSKIAASSPEAKENSGFSTRSPHESSSSDKLRYEISTGKEDEYHIENDKDNNNYDDNKYDYDYKCSSNIPESDDSQSKIMNFSLDECEKKSMEGFFDAFPAVYLDYSSDHELRKMRQRRNMSYGMDRDSRNEYTSSSSNYESSFDGENYTNEHSHVVLGHSGSHESPLREAYTGENVVEKNHSNGRLYYSNASSSEDDDLDNQILRKRKQRVNAITVGQDKNSPLQNDGEREKFNATTPTPYVHMDTNQRCVIGNYPPPTSDPTRKDLSRKSIDRESLDCQSPEVSLDGRTTELRKSDDINRGIGDKSQQMYETQKTKVQETAEDFNIDDVVRKGVYQENNNLVEHGVLNAFCHEKIAKKDVCQEQNVGECDKIDLSMSDNSINTYENKLHVRDGYNEECISSANNVNSIDTNEKQKFLFFSKPINASINTQNIVRVDLVNSKIKETKSSIDFPSVSSNINNDKKFKTVVNKQRIEDECGSTGILESEDAFSEHWSNDATNYRVCGQQQEFHYSSKVDVEAYTDLKYSKENAEMNLLPNNDNINLNTMQCDLQKKYDDGTAYSKVKTGKRKLNKEMYECYSSNNSSNMSSSDDENNKEIAHEANSDSHKNFVYLQPSPSHSHDENESKSIIGFFDAFPAIDFNYDSDQELKKMRERRILSKDYIESASSNENIEEMQGYYKRNPQLQYQSSPPSCEQKDNVDATTAGQLLNMLPEKLITDGILSGNNLSMERNTGYASLETDPRQETSKRKDTDQEFQKLVDRRSIILKSKWDFLNYDDLDQKTKCPDDECQESRAVIQAAFHDTPVNELKRDIECKGGNSKDNEESFFVKDLYTFHRDRDGNFCNEKESEESNGEYSIVSDVPRGYNSSNELYKTDKIKASYSKRVYLSSPSISSDEEQGEKSSHPVQRAALWIKKELIEKEKLDALPEKQNIRIEDINHIQVDKRFMNETVDGETSNRIDNRHSLVSFVNRNSYVQKTYLSSSSSDDEDHDKNLEEVKSIPASENYVSTPAPKVETKEAMVYPKHLVRIRDDSDKENETGSDENCVSKCIRNESDSEHSIVLSLFYDCDSDKDLQKCKKRKKIYTKRTYIQSSTSCSESDEDILSNSNFDLINEVTQVCQNNIHHQEKDEQNSDLPSKVCSITNTSEKLSLVHDVIFNYSSDIEMKKIKQMKSSYSKRVYLESSSSSVEDSDKDVLVDSIDVVNDDLPRNTTKIQAENDISSKEENEFPSQRNTYDIKDDVNSGQFSKVKEEQSIVSSVFLDYSSDYELKKNRSIKNCHSRRFYLVSSSSSSDEEDEINTSDQCDFSNNETKRSIQDQADMVCVRKMEKNEQPVDESVSVHEDFKKSDEEDSKVPKVLPECDSSQALKTAKQASYSENICLRSSSYCEENTEDIDTDTSIINHTNSGKDDIQRTLNKHESNKIENENQIICDVLLEYNSDCEIRKAREIKNSFSRSIYIESSSSSSDEEHHERPINDGEIPIQIDTKETIGFQKEHIDRHHISNLQVHIDTTDFNHLKSEVFSTPARDCANKNMIDTKGPLLHSNGADLSKRPVALKLEGPNDVHHVQDDKFCFNENKIKQHSYLLEGKENASNVEDNRELVAYEACNIDVTAQDLPIIPCDSSSFGAVSITDQNMINAVENANGEITTVSIASVNLDLTDDNPGQESIVDSSNASSRPKNHTRSQYIEEIIVWDDITDKIGETKSIGDSILRYDFGKDNDVFQSDDRTPLVAERDSHNTEKNTEGIESDNLPSVTELVNRFSKAESDELFEKNKVTFSSSFDCLSPSKTLKDCSHHPQTQNEALVSGKDTLTYVKTKSDFSPVIVTPMVRDPFSQQPKTIKKPDLSPSHKYLSEAERQMKLRKWRRMLNNKLREKEEAVNWDAFDRSDKSERTSTSSADDRRYLRQCLAKDEHFDWSKVPIEERGIDNNKFETESTEDLFDESTDFESGIGESLCEAQNDVELVKMANVLLQRFGSTCSLDNLPEFVSTTPPGSISSLTLEPTVLNTTQHTLHTKKESLSMESIDNPLTLKKIEKSIFEAVKNKRIHFWRETGDQMSHSGVGFCSLNSTGCKSPGDKDHLNNASNEILQEKCLNQFSRNEKQSIEEEVKYNADRNNLSNPLEPTERNKPQQKFGGKDSNTQIDRLVHSLCKGNDNINIDNDCNEGILTSNRHKGCSRENANRDADLDTLLNERLCTSSSNVRNSPKSPSPRSPLEIPAKVSQWSTLLFHKRYYTLHIICLMPNT